MTFSSGYKIGAYIVVRPLGQGGMGDVYEVEHERLGARYALKVLTAGESCDGLLKNKFLAEGKLLARLKDPRIVRVFDLNIDERLQLPYFVMDLVLAGDAQPCSLADIEPEGLDEDRIFGWFRDLAVALDYVHAQGVVHRDVKLENVLLGDSGRAVLSDFGISRFFGEAMRQEVDAMKTMASKAVTGSRLILGTRGYMAPEVARGEPATPAADSYSLGVMFVYLLTGMWYERGSKVLQMLNTYKYAWDAVLPDLLESDPNRRPVNLSALAYKLVPVQHERTTKQVPVAAPRVADWRRMFVILFVAAVLTAAVCALAFLRDDVTRRLSDEPDDLSDVFSGSGVYEESTK